MKKTEYIGPIFIRPELTIQECRAILSKNGEEYADQEIGEIRDFILNLAEIEYTHHMRKLYELTNNQTKINKQPDDEDLKKVG